MRRGAVAGENVELVDDALGDVAVQVVARRNRHGIADDSAGGRDPVALGIVHALDIHRAVHGEIEPVDRKGGGKTLDELRLEGFVGVARHRAARRGPGMQQRQVLQPLTIQKAEIVGSQQVGSTQYGEILRLHQHGRRGRAFGMDAADGDTQGHGSFLIRSKLRQQGRDGGKAQPVLARGRRPGGFGHGAEAGETRWLK